MKEKRDELLWLEDLGSSPILDVNSEYVKDAVKFICWLYDCDDFDINKLRYKLFCKKNLCGEKLPPTLDALMLHFVRAAYQSFIWKNSYLLILDLPPAACEGWKNSDDGTLVQHLMNTDAAPHQIVALIVCKCKTGCSNNSCSCRENGFCCTDACNCSNCENNDELTDTEDDESDDELDFINYFFYLYF